MKKGVAVGDQRREREKMAAMNDKLVKGFGGAEEIDQEVEEYEQAAEERLAGEAEAAAAVAAGEPGGGQEEPGGGSQSSPLREEGPKAVAKDSGETGGAGAAGEGRAGGVGPGE